MLHQILVLWTDSSNHVGCEAFVPISTVDCMKVEKRDFNAEAKTDTITLSVYSRVIYGALPDAKSALPYFTRISLARLSVAI